MIQMDFKNFLENNLSYSDIPKNKKILITGSSGFIGKYLVMALAEIYAKKKIKFMVLIESKEKNLRIFNFLKKIYII